jgi:hypothetical protein
MANTLTRRRALDLFLCLSPRRTNGKLAVIISATYVVAVSPGRKKLNEMRWSCWAIVDNWSRITNRPRADGSYRICWQMTRAPLEIKLLNCTFCTVLLQAALVSCQSRCCPDRWYTCRIVDVKDLCPRNRQNGLWPSHRAGFIALS